MYGDEPEIVGWHAQGIVYFDTADFIKRYLECTLVQCRLSIYPKCKCK